MATAFTDLVPGIALSVVVTLAAAGLAWLEVGLFGKAWLETLVIAILLGTAIRSLWTPSQRWQPGIAFSGKILLEIAVVLLGASVSAGTVLALGTGMLVGIVAVVAIAIAAAFAIGRLIGLGRRMAMLVACGNAICGNSAIAAIAPVIGADSEEVAASIAFTAVLGVVVVLGLPLIGIAAGMSGLQFGALAGLTVYAVPQVIAAAAPLGAVAVKTATLVKLVRVVMLGPVCVVLSLVAPYLAEKGERREAGEPSGFPPLHKLVPWFVIGFVVLAGVRSLGWIPAPVGQPMNTVATALTIIAMAALGLGVDVRTVARAGGRVTLGVVAALFVIVALSFALIAVAGLG
ncbi:putative sulfate exporter family transporter [Pararhizobium mangrovi]|uniref:Putative sulfate exporter family transporter n=2 Tax=Pararhizobium mangrovi TaxID=2590452 RepID=A0A506UBC7_9HYPH|nr:putative sulfate exporter family transporter [Pararhizobium mangrovi]TPW29929.1 putative sulfate exporter family transporter [Pararhizobium mangrovi]